MKVLFLDDILIGLDNENRLKLLELLQENDVEESKRLFRGFQMFITTYDRHWYEVAKVHLKDWKFLEFYKGDNGPVIIDNDKGDLERAVHYFDAYDFPAAANYLRKVIEQQLLEKLPEYYTVNEKVTGLIKPPNLETLIDRLRIYYEELELHPPIKLIDSLKKYKTILFNPMSHNDIKSPIYKNDLLDAFKVVDDLKKVTLPKMELLVEKNKIFKIFLPDITYEAEFTLASNLYKIDNDGMVTTTSPKLQLSFWKREGIDYAMDSDSPPQQYSQAERLRIISRGPYNLSQILASLNRTFTDRGLANIAETDLKNAMVCDGKTLTQWLV